MPDIGQVESQIAWVPTKGGTSFSPRFNSAGFVNVDADVNDGEDVTVKANAKSRAELNQ